MFVTSCLFELKHFSSLLIKGLDKFFELSLNKRMPQKIGSHNYSSFIFSNRKDKTSLEMKSFQNVTNYVHSSTFVIDSTYS